MDINLESTETTPESSVDTTTATESSPQVMDAAPVEQEWTPNYKYKAYGKEYEVDEWAKPLINKDNHEHLIKLYEKSGGFDHLKTNFKELEQKYGQTESAVKQFMSIKDAIYSNIDRGDLGKAFQIIGLNDDQIMSYVKQKLEYSQLPPDQRAIVDHYRQTVESKMQVETMLEAQQRQTEELMMERHMFEMEKTFSDPKYAPAITEYNTRLGDPEAFKSVVQQVGANEFYATGRNLPVAEAVDRAIRMLALNPAQAQQISTQAQATQSPAAQMPQTPQAPAPKPIMRVGKGGGMAPIKQRPMRIEDLEKEYRQLTAQS